MKHHRLISLLAVCLALCACQPDTDLADGLVLHIEGSAAPGAKPAVSGINTSWLDGDAVSINGAERTVSVSGSAARLAGVTAPRSGEHHFAFSPAALCPQPDPNIAYADTDFWWEHHLADGSAFRFSYPREYQYDAHGGQQKLAAPMVAVAAHDASSLTFRHLAAALQVEIENPMYDTPISVDSVVVESVSACLNGSAAFSIDPSSFEPSITAPAAASPSYAQRSVRLSLRGLSVGTLIRPGRSLAVQIPLPPLPSNTTLSVRVYGQTPVMMDFNSMNVGRHGNSSGPIDKFTFQHQATLSVDLGRKALIHARAEIRPDGHLLDTIEGSISLLSVFSLAADKQVLFNRNSTSGTYIPSRSDISYLTTSTDRAEARFLVLDYSDRKYLIIFPDGTTTADARAKLGIYDSSQLPDDKFNNHNGPSPAPSSLHFDIMIQSKCDNSGYLLLITKPRYNLENYYKLSDGFMSPSGRTISEMPSNPNPHIVTYDQVDFKASRLIGF